MKYLLAALLLLSGCHQKLITVDSLTMAHTIPGGAYVVMGQSNAVGMYDNASGIMQSRLQAKAIDPVVVVECAVSGSLLSSWMPGAVNYDNCLALVRATGKPLAGIMFWQGEAEAEAGDVALAMAWGNNFITCISSFRSALHNAACPVLYARISGVNNTLPTIHQVIAEQNNVYIAGGQLVTVDDIPVWHDLHYTPDNYVVLAKRFVDLF